MTKKAEIGKFEYGTEDILTENDLRPENTKLRITTFVSGDVLDWLKREAAEKHIGYQTLLDAKLREMMVSSQAEADLDLVTIIKAAVSESFSERGFGFIEGKSSTKPIRKMISRNDDPNGPVSAGVLKSQKRTTKSTRRSAK